MIQLSGIPVAGGSRVGRVVVVEEAPGYAIPLTARGVPEEECGRLARAVEEAHAGLERNRAALGGDASVGEIFRVHGEMLDAFRPSIEEAIRAGASAEQAVARVLHRLAEKFAAADNEMLAATRPRRASTSSAASCGRSPAWRRVAPAAGDTGDGPVVVVARDLSPSDTAALDGQDVAAIAIEFGGSTSHTAVIAKSLGIPCVVGVEGIDRPRAAGRHHLGRRYAGRSSCSTPMRTPSRGPAASASATSGSKRRSFAESHLPAETLDGHRVQLFANVEYPMDVQAAARRGAEGVGLYRTEFLYDPVHGLPTEEEHLAAYRETLATRGRRAA